MSCTKSQLSAFAVRSEDVVDIFSLELNSSPRLASPADERVSNSGIYLGEKRFLQLQLGHFFFVIWRIFRRSFLLFSFFIFCFVFSSPCPPPWPPAIDLLVCVAEVSVPGIGRLRPDVHFGMHSLSENKGNHRNLPRSSQPARARNRTRDLPLETAHSGPAAAKNISPLFW